MSKALPVLMYTLYTINLEVFTSLDMYNWTLQSLSMNQPPTLQCSRLLYKLQLSTEWLCCLPPLALNAMNDQRE